MAINLVAHNCKIYCICSWKTSLEPVVTSLDQDWKRLQSWSFPVLVRSFEVLENVWTGLGLGLFVLGQKTRLDWTFKHYWDATALMPWKGTTANISYLYSCKAHTSILSLIRSILNPFSPPGFPSLGVLVPKVHPLTPLSLPLNYLYNLLT